MRAQCTIASLLLVALTVSALPVDSEDTTPETPGNDNSITESPTTQNVVTTKDPTADQESSTHNDAGEPNNDKGGAKASGASATTEISNDLGGKKPSTNNGSGESSKDQTDSEWPHDHASAAETTEASNDSGKGKPNDGVGTTESFNDTAAEGTSKSSADSENGKKETTEASGDSENGKNQTTEASADSENGKKETTESSSDSEKGKKDTAEDSGNSKEGATEKPGGETVGTTTEGGTLAKDCADILQNNNVRSGVYKIQPDGAKKPIAVFCDMKTDGGGWTVFQKRGDYPGFSEDFFVKKWDEYKNGFGDPSKEYWLGNDNLFALTNQNLYTLRVDLSDSDGNDAYAEYSKIMVGDEDSGYQLSLGHYTKGAANDALSYHNKMKFSTIDRKNDKNPTSCSKLYHGGWWYNACLHANLNGLNLQGPNHQQNEGITWYEWRGSDDSLSYVQMKIRPRDGF